MKLVAFILLIIFSSQSLADCTPPGKIERLWPREKGHIHIQMSGIENMDISNCGNGGATGLLLNFNDTGGTKEGKQMLLSSLLAAFTAGKTLQLCSYGCDSQYSDYSKLNAINRLE